MLAKTRVCGERARDSSVLARLKTLGGGVLERPLTSPEPGPEWGGAGGMSISGYTGWISVRGVTGGLMHHVATFSLNTIGSI